MWMFDEAAFRNLDALMKIVSPSMDEVDMAAYLRQRWSSLGLTVDTDVIGNIHACVKGSRDVNVAICAHMDTTAVQITKILPNGMLQFRKIGLIPHVLLGQRLNIRTAGGIVTGVNGLLLLLLTIYVLRAKTWKRFTLDTNIDSKAVSSDPVLSVGDRGKTVTRLSPMGAVRVGDNVIEVKALEGMIDPGVEVEVVLIEDNKIYVSPVQEIKF